MAVSARTDIYSGQIGQNIGEAGGRQSLYLVVIQTGYDVQIITCLYSLCGYFHFRQAQILCYNRVVLRPGRHMQQRAESKGYYERFGIRNYCFFDSYASSASHMI